MHLATSDTFQLGIGWLNEDLYGEGGFFIMFGFYMLNFWKRYEEE